MDTELETVTELVPGDPGSFPFVPFRCLDILNLQDTQLKELNDELIMEGKIQGQFKYKYFSLFVGSIKI